MRQGLPPRHPLKDSQTSRQIQPLGWTLLALACGIIGGVRARLASLFGRRRIRHVRK